jgi:hypothetical protein
MKKRGWLTTTKEMSRTKLCGLNTKFVAFQSVKLLFKGFYHDNLSVHSFYISKRHCYSKILNVNLYFSINLNLQMQHFKMASIAEVVGEHFILV